MPACYGWFNDTISCIGSHLLEKGHNPFGLYEATQIYSWLIQTRVFKISEIERSLDPSCYAFIPVRAAVWMWAIGKEDPLGYLKQRIWLTVFSDFQLWAINNQIVIHTEPSPTRRNEDYRLSSISQPSLFTQTLHKPAWHGFHMGGRELEFLFFHIEPLSWRPQAPSFQLPAEQGCFLSEKLSAIN